jgi:hypothetical protein
MLLSCSRRNAHRPPKLSQDGRLALNPYLGLMVTIWLPPALPAPATAGPSPRRPPKRSPLTGGGPISTVEDTRLIARPCLSVPERTADGGVGWPRGRCSPAVRTPRGDLWRDVWPLPGTRSALSSERNPRRDTTTKKITIHCARSLLMSAPGPCPSRAAAVGR